MSSEVKSYDFAVIGGGSGGMAAAKEAAKHGASVVLFDYVKPSTQGTTWGLGGTCVNVGCVPKKLMHYAAQIATTLKHDAPVFGVGGNDDHKQAKVACDWDTLVDGVQNHVRSLNFSYRVGLRSAGVQYINALASFVDSETITYTLKGQAHQIKAKHILIATGGRPLVPEDVPGARDLAITSDDLFSYRKTPGKTLVVGASYIGLECAGLLNGLGFEVHVAVRSVLLRGFDRQCAEKIGEIMKCEGVRFIDHLPAKLERDGDSRIKITFTNGQTNVFDTVLYATGRYADTRQLNLTAAGVDVLASGKFEVNDVEQTNVKNIYVIGDILKDRPELTPVAIKTGELLARRLFAGATQKMNWHLVPTTVFTPAEYGTCGLSEEAAIAQYTEEGIEVYLWEYTTLEHAAAHRNKVPWMQEGEYDVGMPPSCLCKLIVERSSNKVIGFHYVGPNAGEVTQGFAVAMRAGATKQDFDDTVGIHPTDAEAFTTMEVTRRSGESWVASGGCGGGKCG